MIKVALETKKLLALVVPNFTIVAPLRVVPKTLTVVPPASGPPEGTTEVTVGAAWKVNWSLAEVAEVPPGVVTVMSMTPAASAGDVAFIEVEDNTEKLLAATGPNLTAETFVKPVPVTETTVPPAVGPTVGFTEVTVGMIW